MCLYITKTGLIPFFYSILVMVFSISKNLFTSNSAPEISPSLKPLGCSTKYVGNMNILYFFAISSPIPSSSPSIIMGTKCLFTYSPHMGLGNTVFSIFLQGPQVFVWKLARTNFFSAFALSKACSKVMSKNTVPCPIVALLVAVVVSVVFVVS